MDSFVGNVLGLDVDGQPITPVFTYADTRNAPAVGDLRRRLGRDFMDAAHDRTGCMLHTSYLPARFAWFAAAEPDLFDQVARWVSVAEWIQQQLTGTLAVSVSVAAWTGLLDRRTLTWDSTWLDRLPVTAGQLSPIVDSLTALGTLTSTWQERWPALRAQLYPAVGDGAAANIGSGCDKPGRIAHRGHHRRQQAWS
ncbi:MAG: FGGY family carbohydrate kinase [Caldilineaceae bacterium]